MTISSMDISLDWHIWWCREDGVLLVCSKKCTLLPLQPITSNLFCLSDP